MGLVVSLTPDILEDKYYEDEYYYSPTQFSVASGYGASS